MRSPLLYALVHVGHDAESMYAMSTIQHFDCSVGVGDGRGLVADDHDDLMCGSGEGDDVKANAGGGKDRRKYDAVIEFAEGAYQTSMLDGCEIRHTLDTRRCRNDLDAARSVEHVFFQRARTAHAVRLGIRRPQSQQHVDVGEAEIGIEQCHLISGLRECDCEIHRGVGLTHTSLAARDSDDLDWARAHPLPQAFGLVGLEFSEHCVASSRPPPRSSRLRPPYVVAS